MTAPPWTLNGCPFGRPVSRSTPEDQPFDGDAGHTARESSTATTAGISKASIVASQRPRSSLPPSQRTMDGWQARRRIECAISAACVVVLVGRPPSPPNQGVPASGGVVQAQGWRSCPVRVGLGARIRTVHGVVVEHDAKRIGRVVEDARQEDAAAPDAQHVVVGRGGRREHRSVRGCVLPPLELLHRDLVGAARPHVGAVYLHAGRRGTLAGDTDSPPLPQPPPDSRTLKRIVKSSFPLRPASAPGSESFAVTR